MNLSRPKLNHVPKARGKAPEDTDTLRKVVDRPDIRRESYNHIGPQNRRLAVHFNPVVPRTAFSLVLLTAFCLLVASAAFATPGTWRRQPTGSLAWLHAVFFLDQNRGWAVGSRGTLLSTTDSGKTWQKETQPTEDAIRDIYFSDEENGWLVCERSIYALRSNDEPRAYLLKTNDGGQHWSRVNMRGVTVDARLTRVIFTRGGGGWGLREGGAVYASNDAGADWHKRQHPPRLLL